MEDIRKIWAEKIAATANTVINNLGIVTEPITISDLTIETPPKPEMGDLAFPMFPFSKVFRSNPAEIAKKIENELGDKNATAAGPYVNVKIDVSKAASVIDQVLDQDEKYGRLSDYAGRKIMIEFSCPNTNKPLHLGHLRNNILGESMSRILKAMGADVRKVNLINDRGIHICKSMLAYQKFGEGKTPESEGIKSDKFVGDYYVKYDKWSKEDKSAEEQARALLVAWENNDPEILELWKKMNDWVISGIKKTYEITGISFDQYYFEHETYKSGRDEILKGLEKGVFYREEDGSVWVDLSDIKLDKKVLLRKDGTSLYLTQDIGTAIARSKDYHFDKMIYVVMSEQNYHFKVLFHVLKKLGFEWAANLFHLSYGMVNLPDGKMKSREGTVVDADDVILSLKDLAVREIKDKEREAEIEDLDKTGMEISLAALHYYLLQVNPVKDMLFNPAESISFNGNTGPYIQYMGARISSMLAKYRDSEATGKYNPSLLETEEEKELIKLLMKYPETISQAAENYNPAFLCSFLYDLAKAYSRFYHEHQVLNAGNADLTETRIRLSRAVLRVLQNAGELLVIPFLEKM